MDGDSAAILYTNRHEIRLLEKSSDTSIPLVSQLRNAIAVDFFLESSSSTLLFWTDIASDEIFRARLKGKRLLLSFSERRLFSVDGHGSDRLLWNLDSRGSRCGLGGKESLLGGQLSRSDRGSLSSQQMKEEVGVRLLGFHAGDGAEWRNAQLESSRPRPFPRSSLLVLYFLS